MKLDVIPIPCMVMAEVQNRKVEYSRRSPGSVSQLGEVGGAAHEGRAIGIHVQRPAYHHILNELRTDHTQT